MGRLLVITRPQLQPGYQLAGVQAYAAAGSDEAAELIGRFLDDGEVGLLAVEEELLAGLPPELRQRMNAAAALPYLALPGGEPASTAVSAQHFVSEMIRRTVGFQLTFGGDE